MRDARAAADLAVSLTVLWVGLDLLHAGAAPDEAPGPTARPPLDQLRAAARTAATAAAALLGPAAALPDRQRERPDGAPGA